MNIAVGSKNETKIQAVQDALALYPDVFRHPNVVGVDANVEEFGHPTSIQKTVAGAIRRAKAVFKDCDFSFGLEGGLLKVPQSRSGYMETSACAIYDGKEIFLGLAPAFEWPKRVTDLIVRGEADASQAFKQLGLTQKEKLGAEKGGISGVLTKGRLTREVFMKHSIMMALIQIEHHDLYQVERAKMTEHG